MAYTRRDIRGGAVQTTLVGDITSGSASCSIATTTGWPDGSTNGSFYVVVDPGTASEEKILCSTRSSGTVNFTTRGADGTTASAHSAGAVIYPIGASVDFDEANYWVAELHGAASGAGNLLLADGADSLTGLAASTAGKFPVSNGTTFVQVAMSGDATLASSGALTVANGAITAAKLATGAGDPFTTVTKGSNETVTSSTTMQDDDALAFTAANGTPYLVEIFVVYAGPAAGDILIEAGEDSTTRGMATCLSYSDSDTIGVISGSLDLNAGKFRLGCAAGKRVARIEGWHLGAGGSFKVRWAQFVSDGSACTIYSGSILRYRALT